MTVRVKVSSHLLEYIPGPRKPSGDSELEVTEGTTVAELLNMLGLPDELEIVTVVNDVYCSDRNKVVKDGDSLQIMPLIAGG
jgi:sulfur carrier protein ThiS